MITIRNLIWFLVLLAVPVLGKDEDFHLNFVKYISLTKSLRFEGKSREDISKDESVRKLESSLFQTPEYAAENLAWLIRNAPTDQQRVAAVRLLIQNGIESQVTMKAIRSVVVEADLEDTTPGVVHAAIEYIGDYGAREELSLLNTLSSHAHPTIRGAAEGAETRITKRLENLNRRKEIPKEEHFETDQVDSSAFSDTTLTSSTSSKWPWMLVGVALLGIIVILLRAAKGKSDQS